MSTSERTRITAIAATWLQAQKRPGESLALFVEPARPDGWILGARIGDVGVSAHCGPAPDEAVIRGVLVGVLADARKQAAIDHRAKKARYGSPR